MTHNHANNYSVPIGISAFKAKYIVLCEHKIEGPKVIWEDLRRLLYSEGMT